jgi:hypothetical protein
MAALLGGVHAGVGAHNQAASALHAGNTLNTDSRGINLPNELHRKVGKTIQNMFLTSGVLAGRMIEIGLPYINPNIEGTFQNKDAFGSHVLACAFASCCCL